MKKLFMLATAAFLFTGAAFAQDGNTTAKKCAKGKSCCKKEAAATAKKDGKDCKTKCTKAAKTATKTTKVAATKKDA